jgi:hypothetical protein
MNHRNRVVYLFFSGLCLLTTLACNPLDFKAPLRRDDAKAVDWVQLAGESFRFDDLRSAAMLVERGLRADANEDAKAELHEIRKEIETRQEFFNSQVERLLEDANQAIAAGSVHEAREFVERALLIRQATNLEMAKHTEGLITAMTRGHVSAEQLSSSPVEDISTPNWADIADRVR